MSEIQSSSEAILVHERHIPFEDSQKNGNSLLWNFALISTIMETELEGLWRGTERCVKLYHHLL